MPYIAPRAIKPAWRSAAAHVYSDARTPRASMAAVALLGKNFAVRLTGRANEARIRALQFTNEINGLKLIATVSAIKALGGRQKGKGNALFSDTGAEASFCVIG